MTKMIEDLKIELVGGEYDGAIITMQYSELPVAIHFVGHPQQINGPLPVFRYDLYKKVDIAKNYYLYRFGDTPIFGERYPRCDE